MMVEESGKALVQDNNKRLTDMYNKDEAALTPAALTPAAVGPGEFVTEGSAGPHTPHA
jgi:hypothetical protein